MTNNGMTGITKPKHKLDPNIYMDEIVDINYAHGYIDNKMYLI